MTLRELYLSHGGKVADKWALYLDVYERVLAPYRNKPVSMVEVGVQNGGSLEIWARYFPEAAAILGCDIDPKCGELRFSDPRISVVVGPANTEETFREITSRVPSFDIFIDDGSHTSRDIVFSFLNYFPRLSSGGLYVVEDLHCAYMPAFGGGIHRPDTSMAFLKALADFVNRPWWERARDPAAHLDPIFGQGHGVDPASFADVLGVSFYDSMCIIEKRPPAATPGLGPRITVGTEAIVEPRVLPGLQAQ
ncbi:class I SAM-dependent methyltransferase [Usitatibacter palustris]|uniref:8-demethyl-8-alpha-L-rhamnosyl tetracenomycin-C 2'-O-methyltransferase n=1 Tax=Usitatibacter palustris TaxID=2732487 RepID=A0A6M4H7U0_9PROT|nr:class I SAM-dependent methyltransferase [Usitatibacter palustris]QJR15686.1 8-demethyl-8-alpha-L-rhamnosyl tetracenomycin-C 2'-O-methyltransferase [Usitatibacter palustris]